jgi:hypothetical protein
MTREEAAVVLATMLAGFPDKALEPESVALWTQEIAAMGDDYAIADKVARGFVRESDHFPTLHAFREAFGRQARADADDRSRKTGLPEAPREKGVPEWVQVWWWARHSREPREERDLPQMASPDAPAGSYMSQADYLDLLRGEWNLAGRPSITLSNLTGEIAEHV